MLNFCDFIQVFCIYHKSHLKYRSVQRSCFSGSDKLIMLFLLLISFEMPTIAGILTFMSMKNFMLS